MEKRAIATLNMLLTFALLNAVLNGVQFAVRVSADKHHGFAVFFAVACLFFLIVSILIGLDLIRKEARTFSGEITKVKGLTVRVRGMDGKTRKLRLQENDVTRSLTVGTLIETTLMKRTKVVTGLRVLDHHAA